MRSRASAAQLDSSRCRLAANARTGQSGARLGIIKVKFRQIDLWMRRAAQLPFTGLAPERARTQALFRAAAAFCAYAPLDPRFTFLFPNLLVFGPGITAQWWLPPLYFKLFPPKLPQTIEPLIMGMPMAFNAGTASDARATIQFRVSGTEPGDYWLRIAGGRCESFEGIADRADLTVHTPDTAWLQMKVALARLGRAGRAIQAFETCLALRPQTAAAHHWLAAIHEQATGDLAKAAEHRRRAEELSAGTQSER